MMGRKATLIVMFVLVAALFIALMAGPTTASSTGPALSIVNPSDGLVTKATTFKVNGTTDGAAVTVNGLKADLTGKEYSLQVSLKEGPNTILVEATDALGNTTAKAVTVVRDTSAPSIVVTEPLFPLETNKNTLHIKGTVEKGCKVLVNGTDATVTNDAFSADIAINSNTTNISVKATDPAGNERVLTLAVRYDTTVALTYKVNFGSWKLNETESKDEIWVYDDVVTVKGKTDPGATVTVDGRPATITANGTFEANAYLRLGRNNITIRTTDTAGNNATGYLNIKKLEPFTVPVETAGLLLIIGLCTGTVGGYFIGRSKERKVQAKAKEKAALAAKAAQRPAKPQTSAKPSAAPAPPTPSPKPQVPGPEPKDKGETI